MLSSECILLFLMTSMILLVLSIIFAVKNEKIPKTTLVSGIVLFVASLGIAIISKPLTEKYGETCTAKITTISKSTIQDNAVAITVDDEKIWNKSNISIRDIELGDTCYVEYKYYQGAIITKHIVIDEESLEKAGIVITNNEI